MTRITLRQLLDHAAENGYGLPAFNVNNMEQILAIMTAAQAVASPVILQVSRGARSYAGDAMVRGMVGAAEESFPDVPICLHQDHGNSLATCRSAIDQGYTSVMMDGSLAEDAATPSSYDENVDVTSRVSAYAHARGVSVEGELGVPRPARDRHRREGGRPWLEGKLGRDQLLTDPDQAVDFVTRTQVDALAIAIGTSHGAYKFYPEAHRRGALDGRGRGDPQAAARPPSGDARLVVGPAGPPGRSSTPTAGRCRRPMACRSRRSCRASGSASARSTSTPTAPRGPAQCAGWPRPGQSEFDPRKFFVPAIAARTICADRYEQFGTAGQASKIVPLT